MEATAIFHFHSFMILFDLHAKLHSYTISIFKKIIHSGCQWSCNFFVPKEMIEICYFIHQIHLLSNLIKERMNNFEEQILQIIMTAILIIFFLFFL